jgi:hypothetical protein
LLNGEGWTGRFTYRSQQPNSWHGNDRPGQFLSSPLIRLYSMAVTISTKHPDARRLKQWIHLEQIAPGDEMHNRDLLTALRVDEVDSNWTGFVE